MDAEGLKEGIGCCMPMEDRWRSINESLPEKDGIDAARDRFGESNKVMQEDVDWIVKVNEEEGSVCRIK